jgi:hypothetical protein
MATLIGMFVLGAVVVPAVSTWTGTMAYDLETGRGRAQVSSCTTHWPWHDCRATLTQWAGEKRKVGDDVVVRSTSELSGTVDVVGRVRGVSTIDEYKRTNLSTQDVLLTTDVWVMPAWARVPFILALGAIWLVLMWAVTRLVHRWTTKRAVE